MRAFAKRWTIALALMTLLVAGVGADKLKTLFAKGQAAETRQDYIAAYGFFKQTYELKPGDLRYRVAYERTRFYAAAEYVRQGLKTRAAGDLDGAIQQFQAALTIDAAYDAAQQELDRTLEMKQKGAGAKAAPQAPSSDQVLQRMVEGAPGPVELKPLNDDLISINATDDSKKLYQTIAQLAGINVIFDPDYVARQVPLKVDRVTLDDALTILAHLTGTFWRPVTNNTILVAQNSQQKRVDFESQVYKTIYLANLTAAQGGQNDLGEVVQAIRTIAGSTIKIQQIVSQNAIAVRGTPDQVALAEKIAADFDKARPEVVVEVLIMQVRREKMKDLGLSPPTNNGAPSIAITGPNATSTTTTNNGGTTGTGTGTTTTGSLIPLTLNTFNNLHGNNFAVSIPPAMLNAVVSDSNTKILQNPQIRAESGQKASLKIGDRVPIAQGSYGTGLGGVGGVGGIGGISPLIGTQFQYIDVGVNIDVTPTVYADRDIGLKLVLDVSSVTGSSNIGGIMQPIISQRKVEHEIRLHEGEVNLLGGIFEEDDIKTMKGLPFLSQLPVLKYLFGEQTTDKIDSEIVFVLIPHIVRSQQLSDLNERAIDVGTNVAVDLHRRSTPPPTAKENQVPANQSPAVQVPANQVPAVQGQPPVPQTQPQPTQNPQASTGKLVVDPAQAVHQVGETFAVNINVGNGQNIASVPIQLTYDPKVLSVLNVSNGDFLSRDGQPAVLVKRDDNSVGQLVISSSRPPDAPGISGSGTVYTVTLQAKQRGKSVVAITKPGARNAQGQAVPLLGSQAEITVQ